METFEAERVLSGRRRGSSRPVLARVVGMAQPLLLKLRGAAQGTGPLVAEIVVATLAERLDLRIPRRALVMLGSDTPTDDRDDELADLLAASVGLNLGFEVLDGARDVVASDVDAVTPRDRAAVLWLDRFVMNPDRTARNPNLMIRGGELSLIDHGAALRFQYAWDEVDEDKPREIGVTYERHVFEDIATVADWHESDERFAATITRQALEAAIDEVPDSFLASMLPARGSAPDAVKRRRAAYVAFLWKRLKAPRAFALEPPRLASRGSRGVPPAWVTAGR
jgi:hypothetical protein